MDTTLILIESAQTVALLVLFCWVAAQSNRMRKRREEDNEHRQWVREKLIESASQVQKIQETMILVQGYILAKREDK